MLHLVFCLDAKLRFDDNAEFRQKDVFNQRDWSQEDPSEVQAAEYNLNYIALDGDIGKFEQVLLCYPLPVSLCAKKQNLNCKH